MIAGTFFQSMMREAGDRPPDVLLAKDWLQNRYATVLERAPWPFLLKEDTFNTVAEVTAGTVTLTLGSATVTETTSNQNGWSSSLIGRYFRPTPDSEFYEITAYGNVNPDTITLERVYEQDSDTEVSYSIFQRFFSLASDVREVLELTYLNSPGVIEKVTQSDLDMNFPNRPQVGSKPSYWAMAGADSSLNLRVELYPVPDVANGVLYRYIQTTPSLSDADASIIPQVDARILRAGWLSDYWSWVCAHSDAPNNALIMSQKYEVEFEKKMQEMFVRECPNMDGVKFHLPKRVTKHRTMGKWSRGDIQFSID